MIYEKSPRVNDNSMNNEYRQVRTIVIYGKSPSMSDNSVRIRIIMMFFYQNDNNKQ